MKRDYLGVFTAVILTLPLIMSGCASFSDARTGALADVVIKEVSQEVVHEQLIEAFKHHYYKVEADTGDKIIFARQATKADMVRWGNLGDRSMEMVVTVNIEPFARGGTLVQADAYIDRGGIDERIQFPGRRPYQSILNETESACRKIARQNKKKQKKR